jgi:hypothetical protein
MSKKAVFILRNAANKKQSRRKINTVELGLRLNSDVQTSKTFSSKVNPAIKNLFDINLISGSFALLAQNSKILI